MAYVARNCTGGGGGGGGGGVRQDGWVHAGRSNISWQFIAISVLCIAWAYAAFRKGGSDRTGGCMPAEVTYRGNLLLYLFCV